MIGLDRHCRRRSHYVIVASPLLPQRFGAQDAVLSTAESSSFSADHTVRTPHNKLSLVFTSSPGFPLINSSSCFDCMYPIRLSWPFSANLTSQPSSSRPTSQRRNDSLMLWLSNESLKQEQRRLREKCLRVLWHGRRISDDRHLDPTAAAVRLPASAAFLVRQ